MGVKVLNIIEYGKYFWIAIWIVFRTFATLHDKGFNIYCLSCMQDYGNKDVITYRK